MQLKVNRLQSSWRGKSNLVLIRLYFRCFGTFGKGAEKYQRGKLFVSFYIRLPFKSSPQAKETSEAPFQFFDYFSTILSVVSQCTHLLVPLSEEVLTYRDFHSVHFCAFKPEYTKAFWPVSDSVWQSMVKLIMAHPLPEHFFCSKKSPFSRSWT